MTKLSAEQIARHAYDAGFRGQGLTTAVAVALAESGGRTTAHNGTPPDNSYGLWQINMLGALGPDRRHQYHLKSNDALFDPDTNARVAKDISSDGKDFTPWSTYTNGAYKDHLTAARKAAQDVTKHHGKPSHAQSGSTQSGALRVDDTVLHAYVKRTHGVSDALGGAAGHLGDVRDIAGDSFGKIGKESGFADALMRLRAGAAEAGQGRRHARHRAGHRRAEGRQVLPRPRDGHRRRPRRTRPTELTWTRPRSRTRSRRTSSRTATSSPGRRRTPSAPSTRSTGWRRRWTTSTPPTTRKAPPSWATGTATAPTASSTTARS